MVAAVGPLEHAAFVVARDHERAVDAIEAMIADGLLLFVGLADVPLPGALVERGVLRNGRGTGGGQRHARSLSRVPIGATPSRPTRLRCGPSKTSDRSMF